MRFRRRLWLGWIVASATLGIGASSQALERSTFPGYAGIYFGMPESDLLRSIAMEKQIEYAEGGGYWRRGVAPVEINGAKFVLNVLIDEGLVRRMSLLDLAPVEAPVCEAVFDQMVTYAQSLYGTPDTNHKGAWSFMKESYEATFRFSDGAVVKVVSFLNKGGKACANTFAFYAPKDAPDDKPSRPGDA